MIRYDEEVSVLYGRCLHRGALLADGSVRGDNLICGVHNWDYRPDTGVSEYSNAEVLEKFTAWVEDDAVFVDADEVAAWEEEHPQPYQRDDDAPPPTVPHPNVRPAAIGGPWSWGILRNQGDGFNAPGAGGRPPQAL